MQDQYQDGEGKILHIPIGLFDGKKVVIIRATCSVIEIG